MSKLFRSKAFLKGLMAATVALALALPAGAQTPDLNAIKARGVLKVGVKVDVPKFGYKDAATGVVSGTFATAPAGGTATGTLVVTDARGTTAQHGLTFVVEDLAAFFDEKGMPASVDHRDLDR